MALKAGWNTYCNIVLEKIVKISSLYLILREKSVTVSEMLSLQAEGDYNGRQLGWQRLLWQSATVTVLAIPNSLLQSISDIVPTSGQFTRCK